MLYDTQDNGTVSGNLVMTTERVGILLGSTLDRSSNDTVNISIITENISKYVVLCTDLCQYIGQCNVCKFVSHILTDLGIVNRLSFQLN